MTGKGLRYGRSFGKEALRDTQGQKAPQRRNKMPIHTFLSKGDYLPVNWLMDKVIETFTAAVNVFWHAWREYKD
jgi:hypothetical protein